MSLNRRTFAKIGTALMGGLVLAKYAEPLALVPTEYRDWIEDRGDFFIVRVPDYKTFERETLNKPTIILMGERTTVRDIEVQGYTNVHAPKGGRIDECTFDTRTMVVEKPREVIRLAAEHLSVMNCTLYGNDITPVGMHFVGTKGMA